MQYPHCRTAGKERRWLQRGGRQAYPPPATLRLPGEGELESGHISDDQLRLYGRR